MSDQNQWDVAGQVEAKRDLRRRMRTLRLGLNDRPERSAQIIERLVSLDVVVDARRLLTYDSIVGEVETGGLRAWCVARGIEIAAPEDGVDASWPDVIVVPGTAFTAGGARIGQGGGWYDRFLPQCRDDAVTIGLAFAPQVLASIPTEPHDVPLDLVVTENGVFVRPEAVPVQRTVRTERPGPHV